MTFSGPEQWLANEVQDLANDVRRLEKRVAALEASQRRQAEGAARATRKLRDIFGDHIGRRTEP